MLKELPITLYPNKQKNFLMFLLCLVFVLLTLYVDKPTESFYWLGLILFGIGVIIFLIQLVFPKSSYLRITEKGILIRSLFKSSFMPWEIIKDFEVGSVPIWFSNKKMIMRNFDKAYNKENFGRELARSMTGFEGGLSDNYGMKHEELVNLLNGYKNKFKQN